ncbi:hypothetical protein N9L68_04875 [bacterium]|nr:hypothetical protein [bacterium]
MAIIGLDHEPPQSSETTAPQAAPQPSSSASGAAAPPTEATHAPRAPFAAFQDAFASIGEVGAGEQAALFSQLSRTMAGFAQHTDRDIKACQQRAGRAEYATARTNNRAREAQAQIDLGAMQRQSTERLRWDVEGNNFDPLQHLGLELIAAIMQLEFEIVSDEDAKGNPAMSYTDRSTIPKRHLPNGDPHGTSQCARPRRPQTGDRWRTLVGTDLSTGHHGPHGCQPRTTDLHPPVPLP